MELNVGDIIQLKKKHPCGGNAWKIIRVGADFRLVCETCGAHIMLPRTKVEKGIKKVLNKSKKK